MSEDITTTTTPEVPSNVVRLRPKRRSLVRIKKPQDPIQRIRTLELEVELLRSKFIEVIDDLDGQVERLTARQDAALQLMKELARRSSGRD